jgi:hypothetical protein
MALILSGEVGQPFAVAPLPDEHKVGHVGPWVNPLLQTFTFGGSDTDFLRKYESIPIRNRITTAH